ncbi:hypothetical protein [Nocardiopsis metallicus]|uniref:Uncharacterized protein n=1 Tax=Nocardiopsis metallicus TaxID=179819 RepID=A0A840WW71_9ACTN|nr:hypothetical protein [Nocardiopsis metallicus]MBB5495776.1 hypothetical protein [Nocardiopsis metallicus]
MACHTYTPLTEQTCMVCHTPAPVTPVVLALGRIDLADTDQPGGIRARVEEAYELIHADIEAAHTGRLADVIEITATANRSAA